MLNSAEHEIFSANKYENANNSWHFHIKYQRNFMLRCNFDYRSSVTAMLQELGWRTLEQRQADARLCLFYKIVYGLVAVPLSDYIQLLNSNSRHCHSLTFRQIHTSHDFYKYSFFSLTIDQWNVLPQNVVCLPTLDSFREAVGRLQHSRPWIRR